ncbi:hypothetical protein FACS1894191_8330 [Clostridia bacterium]|nr:hypothetical protein FACS1894191_8330 [Clostridia bacterium]
MKELRSFRDVIETRFDKEVWAAVSEYIADNPNSLDVRSYRVQEADEAELADLTVKRVDVRDAAEEGIRFDIIAEAEIVMSSRYHSDVETDDASQWFRLSCSGDLNGGLLNFAIHDVSIYNPNKRDGIDNLTDDLVPVIAKEQFDVIADEFLTRGRFSF